MTGSIVKLPRQAKYNRKIENWVVLGENLQELGVIEKMPNHPYEARLIGSIKAIGKFADRQEAAKAILTAVKEGA